MLGYKTLVAATCVAIGIAGFTDSGTLSALDANPYQPCAKIKDNTERLACYDQTSSKLGLGKKEANAKPIASVTDKAPDTKELEAKIANLEAEKQSLEQEVDRVKKEIADEIYDGVTAKIVRVRKLKNKKVILYLDNNQVWQQVSADTFFGVKEGVMVQMKESALGSIFIGRVDRKKMHRMKRLR